MPLMPEQELRRDLLLFSASKWPDLETAIKMAARMEQFILQGNVGDLAAEPDIASGDADHGKRPCEKAGPAIGGVIRQADLDEPLGQRASPGMAGSQKRRWSAEDDENLKRFWHSDRPLEDIAGEMGRTVPSLYCRARALGFSKRGGESQPCEGSSVTLEGSRKAKPAANVMLERYSSQRHGHGKGHGRGNARNSGDRGDGSLRVTPPTPSPAVEEDADISIDRIIHFLRSRDYSVIRVEDGRYRLDGRRVLSASELRAKANQVRLALGQPPFAGQLTESVG